MRTQNDLFTKGAALALGLALAWPMATTAQAANGSLKHAERANKIIGQTVLSSDHQKLGKINNMVVDLQSGHVLYAVVSTSVIGGKDIAVPPKLFSTVHGGNAQLTVDKAKFEAGPQFTSDIDKPENLAQASFVNQVYQYFGQNAWWQGGTASANEGTFNNTHKVKDLIGMKVEDVNNANFGKVSNAIVDLPAGRVLYVIFAPASNLNLGNNLYALPPDALTLSADKNNLVTGIDKAKLASAPHFDANNWPDLTNSSFASKVYQYYGKQAYFMNEGQPLQPTGR
jgi:sporulation protein YlmC with PRC-barrel domain